MLKRQRRSLIVLIKWILQEKTLDHLSSLHKDDWLFLNSVFSSRLPFDISSHQVNYFFIQEAEPSMKFGLLLAG